MNITHQAKGCACYLFPLELLVFASLLDEIHEIGYLYQLKPTPVFLHGEKSLVGYSLMGLQRVGPD